MSERNPFNKAELSSVRRLLHSFNSGQITKAKFETDLSSLLKQKETRDEKSKKIHP